MTPCFKPTKENFGTKRVDRQPQMYTLLSFEAISDLVWHTIMSSIDSYFFFADDDPTIADSLAPFLERGSFMLVVSDGVSALKKAQAHHRS
jgi:hypothetical protein